MLKTKPSVLPHSSSHPVTYPVTEVPFIDLKRQYFLHKKELLQCVDDVLSSGHYILGDSVQQFEKQVARYLNCPFVLAVANGTDALILALKCLGIQKNDEVILPTNSFLATAGAVIAVDATPVLCDVTTDLNIDVMQIEKLITQKTKAIMAVHLTGRPAAMDKIMDIAHRYSLFVIEDAAQSIGARHQNKMTGAIGDIGCFSLHPLKNLHVYGDGGLITTNNEHYYETMKILRNHGLINRDTCMQWGMNSRLDALHASMASFSLNYVDQWNNQRRDTAELYKHYLAPFMRVPVDQPEEHAVYHNFIVQTDRRDQLMNYLSEKRIETKVHYPIPIHLQPAAKKLNYKTGDFPVAETLTQTMLSLPIYSELRREEQEYVIKTILDFYGASCDF